MRFINTYLVLNYDNVYVCQRHIPVSLHKNIQLILNRYYEMYNK